ncbi:MAG: hypothetical protein ACOCUY_02535 [Verrucomicrobiota bacterium]
MPEPYYNDWLHLTTHLLWCYDAVIQWPQCNSRDRSNSAAWLIREGWAQVEHNGKVWRAEAGQWLIPKPCSRAQTFGEGTHLLSVAFEARWADGSPMVSEGLSVVVDADEHPLLERRALPMVRTQTKSAGATGICVGTGSGARISCVWTLWFPNGSTAWSACWSVAAYRLRPRNRWTSMCRMHCG